jgi:hypothetical protein
MYGVFKVLASHTYRNPAFPWKFSRVQFLAVDEASMVPLTVRMKKFGFKYISLNSSFYYF